MSTWPQAWERISAGVGLAEDTRQNLISNYVPAETSVLADGIPFANTQLRPDEAAFKSGLAALRSGLAASVTNIGPLVNAALVELALAMGKPDLAPTSILGELYDWMALNQGAYASSPLIQSRQFTRGSPTYSNTLTGSVVGNGTLYRLTVDRYAYPIESDLNAETVLFTCRTDANSGAKIGQETFDALGQPGGDSLQWYASGYGSGLSLGDGALRGVTGDDTQNLVGNPSFASSSGSGASFALTNWTLSAGSASNLSVSTLTADIYRPCSIEGSTPGALKVTHNGASATTTITQTLSTNNRSLQQTLAYLSRLAINRSNYSGQGTVTVQIGSKSWSVSLVAQSGWVLLLPSIDKNLWFQNFNTANLAVTITLVLTTGSVVIDDFCWSTFTNVGNKLLFLLGGSTAFQYLDTLTFVDTEVGAKIQRWVSRLYPGWSLPSAALNTPPATAPTVATGAAGAVTAGTHYYAVTYVTASVESAPGPLSTVYVADGAHVVSLTAIPTGPGGTTKRGIYRTKANDNAPNPTLYFVAYVNDNVTTTYTDTAADGSITKFPGSVADPA
jgi:hypothetical protein